VEAVCGKMMMPRWQHLYLFQHRREYQMNKPSFTIKAFGYYLIVLGFVLIFSPNILLAIFMMPTTTEVWIRVVGVLVLNIGVYYIFAALCEAKSFFKASVYTRTFVLVSFIAFATFGRTFNTPDR
jgi:hypothetical protein